MGLVPLFRVRGRCSRPRQGSSLFLPPSPPSKILRPTLVNPWLVSASTRNWDLNMASADSPISDTVHTDVLSDARNSCYKARDSFYACLEKESSKKPTEVASVGLLYPAECKTVREAFVKQCRPTWVKHFDRQYCAKKRVQRFLDSDDPRKGPISLPQPYTFKT